MITTVNARLLIVLLVTCLGLGAFTGCTISDDVAPNVTLPAFSNYSWCHTNNDFVGPFSLLRTIYNHTVYNSTDALTNNTFHTLCRYQRLEDPLSYLCKDFTYMVPMAIPVIDEDVLWHINSSSLGLPRFRRTVLALADVNNHLHLIDANQEKVVYHGDKKAHPLPRSKGDTITLRRDFTSLINQSWTPSFVSQMDTVEVYGMAYLLSNNGNEMKIWRVQASPLPTNLTDSLPIDTSERKRDDQKKDPFDALRVTATSPLHLQECLHINMDYKDLQMAKISLKTNDTLNPLKEVIVLAYLSVDGTFIRFVEYVYLVPPVNDNSTLCENVIRGEIFQWNIVRTATPGDKKFDRPLRMSMSIHQGIRDAAQTDRLCDSWSQSRYLIHLYDDRSAWTFPFNDYNLRPEIVNRNGSWIGAKNRRITLDVKRAVTTLNEGETLTSVSSFGSCFTPATQPSQSLWLTFGVNNASGLGTGEVRMVPMPDFSNHRFDCATSDLLIAGTSTPLIRVDLTIAGAAGNYCVDLWPKCPKDSALYEGSCVSRLSGVRTLSFPVHIQDVQPRAITSAVVQILPDGSIGKTAGNHHSLIFVSGLSDLFVNGFSLAKGESMLRNDTGYFAKLNHRHNPSISHMSPSSNGQHVWTLNEYPFAEIDSRLRSQEYCANNSDADPPPLFDQLCQEYYPVEIISPTDYISHYSMCPLGKQVCPLIKDSVILEMRVGYFSLSPATLIDCQPGYYCVDGQAIPCASGFICPNSSMIEPQRCTYDPNLRTTCYPMGLAEPASCPRGHICDRPDTPPVATPPGYFLDTSDPSPNLLHTMQLCESGYYCPIASSFNKTDKPNCPVGHYCPNPSTVIQCAEYSGSGPMNTYCPEGSVSPIICPAGFFCPKPYYSKECDEHTYCPEGSPQPIPCPCGNFCQNTTTIEICPSGYWCPEGSLAPRKCRFMSACPTGSCIETIYFFLLLTFFFSLRFIWMILRGYLPSFIYEGKHLPGEQESAKSMKKAALLSAMDFTFAGWGVISSSFPTKQYLLNIEMSMIDYTVKGKRIISGICGQFDSGKVTAIMGPSGSGKTTLLSILSGQISPTNGQILINGQEENMSNFRTIMGFVPQKSSDIMLRTLTVKETITFYAKMKASRMLSRNQVETMVSRTIQLLGLERVQNTIIGDEKVRGVSGGELKRVNIGIELVGEPTLLYLDEPTSGLDSTITVEIMSTLRRIATLGLTIVTVIHQPRFEVFDMFDNVMILGNQGKTVYFGPSKMCEAYFKKIGYKRSRHTNPADFFLDIANGRATPEANPLSSSPHIVWENNGTILLQKIEEEKEQKKGERMSHKRTPSTEYRRGRSGASIRELTMSSTPRFGEGKIDPQSPSLDLSLTGEDLLTSIAGLTNRLKRNLANTPREPESSPLLSMNPNLRDTQDSFVTQSSTSPVRTRSSNHTIAPLWSQLWLFFLRAIIQQMREPKAILVGIFMACIGAAAIGASNMGSHFPKDPIQPIHNLLSLACGLVAIQASIRIFGGEQTVFWRETRSGISAPVYFLAKNLAHLPFLAVYPLAVLSIFSFIAPPQGSFLMTYLVLLAGFFCCSGMGYIVSILFISSNATIVGCLYPLGCNIFAGVSPTLYDLRTSTFGRVMTDISYARWMVESLLITEFDGQPGGINQFKQGLENSGYNMKHQWGAIWMLAIYGIVFRAVAMLTLILTNQGNRWAKPTKQKKKQGQATSRVDCRRSLNYKYKYQPADHKRIIDLYIMRKTTRTKRCLQCRSKSTVWRKGPKGTTGLCNVCFNIHYVLTWAEACGVRYHRALKSPDKFAEYVEYLRLAGLRIDEQGDYVRITPSECLETQQISQLDPTRGHNEERLHNPPEDSDDQTSEDQTHDDQEAVLRKEQKQEDREEETHLWHDLFNALRLIDGNFTILDICERTHSGAQKTYISTPITCGWKNQHSSLFEPPTHVSVLVDVKPTEAERGEEKGKERLYKYPFPYPTIWHSE
ncbi:abc transporter family protein [Planoprotostelium fungivorum]|uniref:Abc transporter family protein n=1 Tax=Planoprotostelium fungivorum TaxID=1890364 RepID=A0A2P6N734_9EUKA|nr:abc transporter family protein [Planoprotostelium fungivorum]